MKNLAVFQDAQEGVFKRRRIGLELKRGGSAVVGKRSLVENADAIAYLVQIGENMRAEKDRIAVIAVLGYLALEHDARQIGRAHV